MWSGLRRSLTLIRTPLQLMAVARLVLGVREGGWGVFHCTPAPPATSNWLDSAAGGGGGGAAQRERVGTQPSSTAQNSP